MKASQKAIDLIKHYESLHDGDLTKIGLQPKLCPAGVVTWGYGHTESHNGQQIKDFETARKQFPEMETMTIRQAEDLLAKDLIQEEKKIQRNLLTTINQDQFDALVSYFFNIGLSTTMTLLVNHHASGDEITEWLTKHYITVGGVYMEGLYLRRKSEALLYTTGELKFFN